MIEAQTLPEKLTDLTVIRQATLQDFSDIYGDDVHPEPDYYYQARMKTNAVYIAKKDGVAIGYLSYTIWWGNCPFIEHVKVNKDYVGRGVAVTLLNAAAHEMRERGFSTLLSSTDARDEKAIAFHEKYGFKKLNTLELPHGLEQFFSMEL